MESKHARIYFFARERPISILISLKFDKVSEKRAVTFKILNLDFIP